MASTNATYTHVFDVQSNHARILSVTFVVVEGDQALLYHLVQGALLAAARTALLHPQHVFVPRRQRIITDVRADRLLAGASLGQQLLVCGLVRLSTQRRLQAPYVAAAGQRLDVLFGVIQVHRGLGWDFSLCLI